MCDVENGLVLHRDAPEDDQIWQALSLLWGAQSAAPAAAGGRAELPGRWAQLQRCVVMCCSCPL